LYSVPKIVTHVISWSRQQYYDAEIVDLSLLTILKYIVINSDVVKHLTVVLGKAPCHDVTDIASGVIQLWLEYASVREQPDESLDIPGHLSISADFTGGRGLPGRVEKDETFYAHEKGLFFSKILSKQTPILPRNDTALSRIVHFITAATRQSLTIQWGFLDAGALAVVLIAFMDGVPMLSDLLDAFRLPPNDPKSKQKAMSCIPLSSIRTEANKIWDMTQNPAFQVLLQTQIFTKRRRMCASLLDALLGPGGGVDDVYSELRDVFDGILYC
jgi:hypothetical protein